MKTLLIGIILFFSSLTAFTQTADTLRITLPEAEQQFTKNNFSLLAQKFNIEASKAQIIQAQLLPNPTINLEQTVIPTANVANSETIGAFGQRAIQIQQLILIGGKRNKQVAVAKIGAEMSEYQFSELVRELVFQLRSNFYSIHYLQKTLGIYTQEIQNITRLVSAYKEQVEKGNIPVKEVIRLESFLITLQTEQTNISKQIIDNESVIKILLSNSDSNFIQPIANDEALDGLNLQALKVGDLITNATENRPDRKLQETSIRLASANLALQKAFAKPDVVVGYSYDRAGSYVNNYHALTVSIGLPFFNKNQGNIKAAEYQIEGNKQYLAQTENQLRNEVLQAYSKAQLSEDLYRKMDKTFPQKFQKLIQGVVENYQKRNLTLIEFTDFLESYKNSVTQINTLQNDRIQAFEFLNFVVGRKVIVAP